MQYSLKDFLYVKLLFKTIVLAICNMINIINLCIIVMNIFINLCCHLSVQHIHNCTNKNKTRSKNNRKICFKMIRKWKCDCFYMPKRLKNSIANDFRRSARHFCVITHFTIVICVNGKCCKYIGTEIRLNKTNYQLCIC